VLQRTVDARLDTETLKLVPEQAGLALDVHATLDALEAAVLGGAHTVSAKLVTTPAQRSLRELEGKDFSQVLAAFETRYNPGDKDRAFNLRVAARHVDGRVLLPGEVFDFNAVVGERSEQNGFRPAHVIAGGEITDGVGGGTCQIAGTLYAAVYFAGLNVIERSTHTRPSAYLKLGLDATVSYPKLNLRFQNDLAQAVAISAHVDAGKVRVELRGAGSTRAVSFVRRVDAITPYREENRDDPSLPAGVRVLSQRGVPGFDVTSFRVIRDVASGRIVRERRKDSYPPTQQVWRVGRGNPPSPGYKPPPHDTRGEYTADAYLILSHSADKGVTEERRTEGRSGVLGWTAREGMPQPAL
jgi:vancomycin resistance protein YoaR